MERLILERRDAWADSPVRPCAVSEFAVYFSPLFSFRYPSCPSLVLPSSTRPLSQGSKYSLASSRSPHLLSICNRLIRQRRDERPETKHKHENERFSTMRIPSLSATSLLGALSFAASSQAVTIYTTVNGQGTGTNTAPILPTNTNTATGPAYTGYAGAFNLSFTSIIHSVPSIRLDTVYFWTNAYFELCSHF